MFMMLRSCTSVEDDDVVTLARPCKRRADAAVGPVPLGRHAEGGRLLGIDVRVELIDEVGDLLVRDLGARTVAAVALGEVELAGGREALVRLDVLLARHPDLDVLTDTAERELLQVRDTGEVVESDPVLNRPDVLRLRCLNLGARGSRRRAGCAELLLEPANGQRLPLVVVAADLDEADVLRPLLALGLPGPGHRQRRREREDAQQGKADRKTSAHALSLVVVPWARRFCQIGTRFGWQGDPRSPAGVVRD